MIKIKYMDKESKNFSKILKSFKNKWVVVSQDYSKVFASGNTLEKTLLKIKGKNNFRVFLVTPFSTSYSPHTHEIQIPNSRK